MRMASPPIPAAFVAVSLAEDVVVFLLVFAERLSLLPLVSYDRHEFEDYLGNVGSNLLEKASFTEVGQFMQKLRKDKSVASRALEFLILTAARTMKRFWSGAMAGNRSGRESLGRSR